MDKVEKLFKTYKTNNPFTLIDQLGCGYCEANIGSNTLGMFINEYEEDVIELNNRIDDRQKLFVASHELGHLVAGTEESTPFLRTHLYGLGISDIEAEANRFAFQLLMYDMEPNECITTYGILDYFHLPYGMERFINPKNIHFIS